MHIVDVIDWITDREDLNELRDLEIVVKEQINKLSSPRELGGIRSVWGSVNPHEFYDDDKNGTL